jgi:hypothetical protein
MDNVQYYLNIVDFTHMIKIFAHSLQDIKTIILLTLPAKIDIRYNLNLKWLVKVLSGQTSSRPIEH